MSGKWQKPENSPIQIYSQYSTNDYTWNVCFQADVGSIPKEIGKIMAAIVELLKIGLDSL